jgi:hypothetical protein
MTLSWKGGERRVVNIRSGGPIGCLRATDAMVVDLHDPVGESG